MVLLVYIRFLAILCLIVLAVCSNAYSNSTPCSSGHNQCDFVMKTRRVDEAAEAENDGQQDARTEQEHKTANGTLQNPDTKVTSTPRLWKSQTNWHYSIFLRHVHGVLNIIGWGSLMPTGIIIARYFREFPMRCEFWYSTHVICQTCGYVMGIVGWGFGISQLGKSHKPFLIFGIIIIILTTIQMFSAILVQAKKESKWRRCWEICHRVVGYVIMGMIIGNIFEGINSQRHPQKWRWAYGGILSAFAFLAVALEIARWIKLKIFKQTAKFNANMYSPT